MTKNKNKALAFPCCRAKNQPSDTSGKYEDWLPTMLMMRKWCTFLFFAFACQFALLAQLGTWNVLHLRWQQSDNLTFFGEAQLRSLSFYDEFHYHEFKGGASYRLSPHFSLTGGLGRYDTYMAGSSFRTPKSNEELRTWLELGMRNTLGKINFEHRYRAEQRFTRRGYRNRFRYRLSATVPVTSFGEKGYELFASVWNEVFLTNKAPYFERNRFFLGTILRQGKFSWNLGWVRQFDYRLDDEIGRSFLQIGWQTTLSKGKKPLTTAPEVEEN
jgi:hypothetical protein